MNQNDPEHTKNASRTAGIGMFILAWLVFFGLLAAFFNGWLSNEYNPNQNPSGKRQDSGPIELILQPNRHHHYLVNGSINDGQVTFLLDTGATDVVIPQAIATQLKLQRGDQQFAQTANGVVAVYSTELKHINIGGIHFSNVRASINPGMNQDVVLLGMSALRQIEFSQRGDTLILRQ